MGKEELEKLDPRILEICRKLKELRIQKGWTSYEAFALANDLSRQSYWSTENGRNLTLKTLFRLLDLHQVSIEEFLFQTEISQNGKQNK